jgi:hypothetical protein
MRAPHFHSIGTWLTSCGAILLTFGIAAPAMTELSMPQVPGFSNNYPWFNEVIQHQGDQSFQWFLLHCPNIAETLARPELLYDANWRSRFPSLQQYLANHPYEWQELNGENWAEGPIQTQWGAYDGQHRWRDAHSWHRDNPNWFYDNRDWASLDSHWLNEDGAYDQQHRWHNGEWWYKQNPNWVTGNHPSSLKEHQNWEGREEQQNYRRHATFEPTRQYGQQRGNATLALLLVERR